MPISQGSMHLYFHVSGKPLNYLNFFKGLREEYRPSADEFAHLISLVRKLLSAKYPNINNVPLDLLSKDHSVLIDKYLQLFKCCNSVFKMESSFLCSVNEDLYNHMLRNSQASSHIHFFVKNTLASDMHRLTDLTSKEISEIYISFHNGSTGKVTLSNVEEVHKVGEQFIDSAIKALQDYTLKQYGIEISTDDCMFLINSLMAYYNDRLFTSNSIIFNIFESYMDWGQYLVGGSVFVLLCLLLYYMYKIRRFLTFFR